MTKKNIFRSIGFFILLYLMTNLVGYLIRKGKPNFQDGIIEKFKTDNQLINEVGPYESHEFSYPTNELELDSLHFELIIFGAKRNIVYTGCALRKKTKNWEIKRISYKIE